MAKPVHQAELTSWKASSSSTVSTKKRVAVFDTPPPIVKKRECVHESNSPLLLSEHFYVVSVLSE